MTEKERKVAFIHPHLPQFIIDPPLELVTVMNKSVPNDLMSVRKVLSTPTTNEVEVSDGDGDGGGVSSTEANETTFFDYRENEK